MSTTQVRRALISVSDKARLDELAEALRDANIEIVSSGGTAAHLEAAGFAVTRVADVTGAPEMLGGRVKTLHPNIHAGLLADQSDPDHLRQLEGRGIAPFQLLVVNLYPFEATVADPDVDPAAAIENIDIGGPAMIRAAAKNHASVAVVTSPDQYSTVIDAVRSGGFDDAARRALASAAFGRTAAYDAAIVTWMARGDVQPARLAFTLEKADDLRYGENPHQAAALYRIAGEGGWWDAAELVQGKPMSFNNYADAEAAWRLVNDIPQTAVAVIKHANPSGVAIADDVDTALSRAWDGDPLSAFGSVIAFNRPINQAAATFVAERYVEVVVAPDVAPEAREAFATKDNLRVVVAPPPSKVGYDMRSIDRGFLVQERDEIVTDRGSWKVAGTVAPSDQQWSDLEFAWLVGGHTKSNAIVIVKDGAAVGVGAGDQSRVGAAQRALQQAGDRATGSVAASDAFFPFADGVEALAEAGVRAIVEPGGSMRDEEVIAAADRLGVSLVFTGRRHFRH